MKIVKIGDAIKDSLMLEMQGYEVMTG